MKWIKIFYHSCFVYFFSLSDTENAVNMLHQLRADKILNSQSGNHPSNSALAIIKAGAQRWQRVHFPYLVSKFTTIAHALFPEIISALVRDAYLPSAEII